MTGTNGRVAARPRSPGGLGPGGKALWVATAIAAVILTSAVVHGTAEKVHARLLVLGESMWPGYAALRMDPTPPTCSLTGGGDAFEDDGSDRDGNGNGSEGVDPGGADDGDEANDGLDDLFGDDEADEVDPDAAAQAQAAALASCKKRHEDHAALIERLTPSVRAYRALELFMAGWVEWGIHWMRHSLVALCMLCAIATTALRGHIALRTIHTRREEMVSQAVQLAANVLLATSWWALWRIESSSGVEDQATSLPLLWLVGFAGMAVANSVLLARRGCGLVASDAAQPGATNGGRPSLAACLLTVPLYAMLVLIAGSYFLLVEQHVAGLAIYLQKITEHALLYVHVGLYVWIGMLLKETRLAALMFDVLRPWRLSPEVMACVVVVAAAVPTAYSGASGIFVIAAGAIIYEELRRAGAREQMALAATAMSGSLGVVLSPCLLVVIVASLNKPVTTTELFHWGGWVFLLTASLFVVGVLLLYRPKWQTAPVGEAMPASWQAGKPLLPYAAIGAVMVAVYAVGLDAVVNEHTAPVILPAVLLVLLWYDRRRWVQVTPTRPLLSLSAAVAAPHSAGHTRIAGASDDPHGQVGFLGAVLRGTSETTSHIGALLMLMAVSVSLGGVVERAELMQLVPATLGSPAQTMALLVVVLVIIGMTMDPYGAVILVSATIANVAYQNGIHPVHFWMVVLVAFELGYLSPPVALNHLLTRRVVEHVSLEGLPAEAPAGGWRRYERILLPLAVMGSALLLVAFVPLAW